MTPQALRRHFQDVETSHCYRADGGRFRSVENHATVILILGSTSLTANLICDPFEAFRMPLRMIDTLLGLTSHSTRLGMRNLETRARRGDLPRQTIA